MLWVLTCTINDKVKYLNDQIYWYVNWVQVFQCYNKIKGQIIFPKLIQFKINDHYYYHSVTLYHR